MLTYLLTYLDIYLVDAVIHALVLERDGSAPPEPAAAHVGHGVLVAGLDLVRVRVRVRVRRWPNREVGRWVGGKVSR